MSNPHKNEHWYLGTPKNGSIFILNPAEPSDWILATGIWDDAGIWEDDALWID